MTLHLLLHLVLPDKALVPSRVVVVGEELGQQEVHVGSSAAILAVRAAGVTASRLRVVCRVGHLGEVLNVYRVVRCLLRAVKLDATAFLTDEVIDAVMVSRCVLAVVMASLRFQAVVSHAEHLTREGVRHDRLARLTRNLSHNACATDTLSPTVADGMRRLWLLPHGL